MRKLNKTETDYLDVCIILIDTREKLPLEFQRHTQPATLNVGDYSIIGPDGRKFDIYIERKTKNDYVGSVIQGRDRFERELERSMKLDHFAIVIEGASFTDIVDGNYRSEASPKAVVQTMVSWAIQFGWGPPWFAIDRSHAARIVESLLEKFVKGILVKERSNGN